MSSYDPFDGARKAASVIVLRDIDAAASPDGSGIEVLMLQRAERAGDLRSNAAVFPGGVLDARDRDAHVHCLGWNDAQASARLRLAEGGLDYLVAAVRETFEEVGLLFLEPDPAAAGDAHRRHAGFGQDLREALHARAHTDWRGPMQRSERSIAELCRELGLCIDLREWAYFSHWLTPPGAPKRFDTRFFVTRAPDGQQAEADYGEAQSLMWLTPLQALDRERGLTLLPVTRRTLQELSRFPTAQTVIDHARQRDDIELIMPRRAQSARGMRVVLPDEHAWAEVGRIDPSGQVTAHADIVPGRVVRLSPGVLRVTAPNAGVMTGPGTNSYLVGCPQANRWTVIDPGPADAAHLQALLAAAPGPVERILVTHTHIDHSPGAVALAEATGAPVFGRRPWHAAGQDASFSPKAELAHGDRIELGPTAWLDVLHTPGHASNHLCFWLPSEKTLFTGDHVMQGSTVVINPPDGDMSAYLRSLQGLLELDLDWLAPGHGFLVARPHEVIRALIRHRLGREARVKEALQALSPAPIDTLLPRVYADVPAHLHPMARRSLLAHLLKLREDGWAACSCEEVTRPWSVKTG
jgi:glyoxylase-like metal-dependent hydrolase (beta-lactamase superfamily II)/8-oxo-dGTP pyrophosphatase MutT (NUDIX family)